MVSREGLKEPVASMSCTSGPATEPLHCSAGILFWQLSIDHDMDAQYQVKCNLYIPWFWKLKTKILHIRYRERADVRTEGRKQEQTIFSGKFVQFRIKNYR